jgi:hypothetical protein
MAAASATASPTLTTPTSTPTKGVSKPIPLQPLDADTAGLFADLEERLSFDDIIFFRSLAEKELSQTATSRGWLGGLTSLTSWASGAWTGEEEKKQLLQAFQYDPERMFVTASGPGAYDSTHFAADEPHAFISVLLNRGSVTVGLSPPTGAVADEAIPFLELVFGRLDVGLTALGSSSHLRGNINLRDLEVLAFAFFSAGASPRSSDQNQSYL